MSKDKSDRGIIDGMLGGLIVSLLNPIFQANKRKTDYDDWDKEFEKLIFDSFSHEVDRKREGYKLKYDINESKVKSKFLNLLPINKYLYSLEIDYEKNESAIEYLALEDSWNIRKTDMDNIVVDNIYRGLISIKNIKPKYWIYTVKESRTYMKITITNRKEGKFTQEDKSLLESTYIYDDYICLEIDEARQLAKEMKKYYHKYVERVVILEDLEEDSSINESEYRDTIQKAIPDYFKTLEIIKKINQPKYAEISNFLENINLENPLYVLLNFFNLATQLYEDGYYNDSIMVFKSLLDSNEALLKESYLESKIYERIMDIYVDLKLEKEIIDLIESRYKEGSYFMRNLAGELYNLGLYMASNSAYKVIIRNEDAGGFNFDIFEAYMRTENDEGMKAWRKKLFKKGEKTYLIDKYLNDEDIEGLVIKIARYEKNEDWKQVVNYCNKYNKLVLLHPWKTMEDRVAYEFKKINAYIKYEKYTQAWNSTCKTRMILISNFKGSNYFKYLSKVESYMSDISLKKDCFLDALYHYIMKKIYIDIFLYYTTYKKISSSRSEDLYLQDLIEKNKFREIWSEVEKIISYEYDNISKVTIRDINLQLNNILEKNNIQLKLDGPKKLYPNIIARDFDID